MPHVVFKVTDDYYHVLVDYSGSPRHAALSEADWQTEYTNGAAYAQMRTDNPGFGAGIKNKGVGKWKTADDSPHLDPLEALDIASNGTADFDGVLAVDADGVAKHTLTIKKVDENGSDIVTGTESIRILSTAGVPISDTNPSLVNGSVTIDVGPISDICDLTISARDVAGNVNGADIKIRFK